MIKNYLLLGFTLFLALCFNPCSLDVQASEIKGIIDEIQANFISINGMELELSEDAVIIFSHTFGSELIEDSSLIPEKVFAQYKLNREKKVQEIIFFNCYPLNSGNNKAEEIFYFTKEVDSYQLSWDEKYLAYYSGQLQLLTVIDLKEQKILWQNTTNSPVYRWMPNKNILTFAKENNNQVVISNFHLSSLSEEQIFCIPYSPTLIDTFWWSPQGNYLSLLVIKGLENAHGYSELLLINTDGEPVFEETDHIHDLDWFINENYVVVSKYTEDDFSGNKIQLLNLKTKEKIPLSLTGEIQFAPLVSINGKGIYYSIINGLYQEVFYYDLSTQKNEFIFRDLKYLNNFTWLNNEELVFTGGPQSQIVIFNTQRKDFDFLGIGFQPMVRENHLYFISSPDDHEQRILYKYFQENKIDLQED